MICTIKFTIQAEFVLLLPLIMKILSDGWITIVFYSNINRRWTFKGFAIMSILHPFYVVIFALIASQLRSYSQPLIILAGVPFGAAGALVGHYILGFDLSFISIFGMVALAGVVVNDSLVLVDRYNKLRAETGMSPEDAVVAAAQRRFRAIFLTTATTALGLTPMLFETSTQAQFLVPMAVSLATGIVFASIIILFLVPALVHIREDFRRDKAGATKMSPQPA